MHGVRFSASSSHGVSYITERESGVFFNNLWVVVLYDTAN